MKVVLISLVAGFLAVAADIPPPTPPAVIDQIVAKVNGDIVSQDELRRLVRSASARAKG
jgi:hypothetical protein